MEDFQSLFSQAVKIKNSEMESRRKIFEVQPLFVKSGLYYYPKFEAVRTQDFSLRYFACETLKQNGNVLFKKQLYDQAVKQYEQSLSIFKYISNKNPNWRKEGIFDDDLVYNDDQGTNEEEKEMISQMKFNLYQNISVSYLKLNDTKNCIASTEEALKIDPKSVKSLYRKAKALTNNINATHDDFKTAISCLKQALKYDPHDKLVSDTLVQITSTLNKNIESEHLQYKNMFKKSNKTNEQICSEKPSNQTKIEEKSGQNHEKLKENQQKLKNKKEDGLKQEKKIDKELEKKIKEISKDEGRDNQQDLEQSDSETEDDRIRWNSDFGKLLSLQKDQNNFDYDLSYEMDQNANIPPEINELGHFIETKGKHMVQLFEMAGKQQQAYVLKEKLKKALSAKIQLEKIARLDFNRPTKKLQEMAQKHDIDIYDKSIKNEFKKIQEQNLVDIRAWLAQNDQPDLDTQAMLNQMQYQQSKNKENNFEQNGKNNDKSEQVTKKFVEELNNSKQQQQKTTNQQQNTYNMNSQIINNYQKKDNNSNQSKENNTLNIAIIGIMIAIFIFNAGMHLLKD